MVYRVELTEHAGLRNVLHGRSRHRTRIIYSIDEARRLVTVLHIRHGGRDAEPTDQPDEQD